jgi:hypothetical protein
MFRALQSCQISGPAVPQLFKLTLAVALYATSAHAQSPSFVSFDPPDSTQGTDAVAINQNGVITGWYIGKTSETHGFVRSAAGAITEFDPVGLDDTFPTAINSGGTVVGFAAKSNDRESVEQGFLRAPGGHISGIFVAGLRDTEPFGISDSGQVTGAADDSNGHWTAFLRDTNGVYTTFQAPDAGSAANQGTTAKAINASGVITGYYVDSSNVHHGFVRDASGTITEFDGPAVATQTGTGTFPNAINASGQIVGVYDGDDRQIHAFVRDASGVLTTVDMASGTQTFPVSINDGGSMAGQIIKGSRFAGYRRDALGNFFAVIAPVPNNGTAVNGINNSNRMTGTYTDTSGISHGFVQ